MYDHQQPLTTYMVLGVPMTILNTLLNILQKIRTVGFIILMCITMSGTAWGSTPRFASLELTLSHTQSGLLNGSKAVYVRIYSLSNGNTIWEKMFPGLPFVNGNVTLPLGPFKDFDLMEEEPGISINVDGNELVIPLRSVLYAFQSKVSEKSLLAEKALNLKDTNALYIDSSSQVGFGTMSPTEKVHISGNIKIEGTEAGIIFSDGSKIKSKNDIISNLLWKTRGQNIYYNNGFIGIGTQTPGSPLTVSGDVKLSALQTNKTTTIKLNERPNRENE